MEPWNEDALKPGPVGAMPSANLARDAQITFRPIESDRECELLTEHHEETQLLSKSASEAIELPASSVGLSFSDARARYQTLIFGFVSRRIRPVEDAEDIVAAVFVDAYRHWNKLRGEPRLWLLGIARRKVADALRRRKTWWRIREEDMTGDAMAAFVNHAEARAAAEVVAALPPDERDALMLQVLEELPIEEIAAVLGRSPKATNSLLQRARNRVRRIVEKRERQEVLR